MTVYPFNGEAMMYEIDHDNKEVVVSTKDVAIGSMEDRIIRCLVDRGYKVRERSKMTTALTVVNKTPFIGKEVEDSKDIMYKKYEVIYKMRKSPNGDFESKKYLARVIAEDAQEVREKVASAYVQIVGVFPVGRKRSSFLSNKNIKFHSLGV